MPVQNCQSILFAAWEARPRIWRRSKPSMRTPVNTDHSLAVKILKLREKVKQWPRPSIVGTLRKVAPRTKLMEVLVGATKQPAAAGPSRSAVIRIRFAVNDQVELPTVAPARGPAANMDLILGFDPGGTDGFGWCVLQDAPDAPVTVHSAGVADNAAAACAEVLSRVPKDSIVRSAGIDAPMFWSPAGDRQADRTVRASVKAKGAPSPGGTVQAVNSLRGACLTQGIMLAGLLRKSWPHLPITEAHPKAYLWTTGIAGIGRPTGAITLASLKEFAPNAALSASEHVRDAAIAAFASWAMTHKVKGWRDLFLEEVNPYVPIPEPIAYWYPLPSAAQQAAAT